MVRFLKGIIVGLGGVAPGLSGSVLLIIFGLYQRTLDALGHLFTDFRKKIQFLLPLVIGMICGVLLFSRAIDFFLQQYEMPTRFCFLGLILGTLPMVWREVTQKGFAPRHILLVMVSAGLGFWFFTVNPNAFPQISDPTLVQSILLGVAVAATAIIPGVDPAVFLSTLGFYEMYVSALATLRFQVLLPMVIGLAAGAVLISFLMSQLFLHFYTITYCTIFGIFLSMIPNMLTDSCILGWNIGSCVSLLLMLLGFVLSFYLGDLEKHNRIVCNWLQRFKKERG